MIVIDVLGTPAPKGSSRAMMRGGRPVFVPGSSSKNAAAFKRWEGCVRLAAIKQRHSASPAFVEMPIAVALRFHLARPTGHYGTGKNSGVLKASAPSVPAVKPDIDKLARSTLDALTGVVFDDDSRIVELVVLKQFALPGEEGARIVIKRWTPT